MGVVDEELRICPEYVSGQIAIGGYSLAEGYLGDTTLTKEKFDLCGRRKEQDLSHWR